MTETKRFILADIGFVYDNEKLIGMKDIVEVMNALYDENQLLHKINEETIDFMYDNFDLNIIFTDRELNDICNEMGWELSEKGIKIKQLEKENEQLKKENEFLKRRCNEYWEEAGLNNDYFE